MATARVALPGGGSPWVPGRWGGGDPGRSAGCRDRGDLREYAGDRCGTWL